MHEWTRSLEQYTVYRVRYIKLELVQNVTDWTNKNHCSDPHKGIVYIDFEANTCKHKLADLFSSYIRFL